MKNIFLIGFIKEDLSIVGQALSEKLDFFYLDAEALIDYSLINKNKMQEVCGIDYMNKQEKAVVYSLNSYERTVATMNYETFINNLEAISSSNILIYLRLTKAKLFKRTKELNLDEIEKNNQEITEIVFETRDKLLKKNCNLSIKYSIDKIDNLIEEIINNLENI